MQLSQILKLDSIEAAPLLLGCLISRYTAGGRVKLMITETEAYNQSDPASHSFRGLTPRTVPMFEAGGRLYVYFTYGLHYCVNIVVGPKGVGEAVLLRAAQPLEGLDIMRRNRGVSDAKQLANGPAKLAQAMGIADTSLTGKILNKSSILLERPDKAIDHSKITAGPRIGIKKGVDEPWRFYISGSPYISKR